MLAQAKAVNEIVKGRLGDSPRLHHRGWVSEFIELPAAMVKSMFGVNGEALHSFLSSMDTQHPDLEGCVEEKVFGGGTLPAVAALISLAQLAVDKGRYELLEPLADLKLVPPVNIVSKSFVRCLKTNEQRLWHRIGKKPQVIDMSTIARKGEELWNAQPSSFRSLVRYENAYAEEIGAANRRAARFLNLGCTAMHAEIMKTVDAFEGQVADCYLGFNRLTFNAACVVLAKWHGYNLVTPSILSDFPPERNYRVTVESKYWKSLSWDMFVRPDEAEIPWPYSPRVYPLAEMEPLPSDVKEIVGLCENYVGFGGRPLFDHYAVMVPGIDYPPQRDEQYTFRTPGGVLANFADQNEARFALDKILLAAGAFSAVVIGERDGKGYCLCVWSC